MFCQFSGCDSVRDISNGLNSANGNLNHLGICRAPFKSTVAYQNAKRDSGVFRRIFYALLAHFGQQTIWQRTKFRFKLPIKLLDSSTSHADHVALRMGTLHNKERRGEDAHIT